MFVELLQSDSFLLNSHGQLLCMIMKIALLGREGGAITKVKNEQMS